MSDTPPERGPLAAPDPVTPPVTAPLVTAPIAATARDQQGRAVVLMCFVAFLFGMQDGISRGLAAHYSPFFIVMVRYWFMAALVVILAMRQPGGLRAAVRTRRPLTQILRGVLLVLEIVVVIEAFVRLGLIATHAIFACGPLLVVALSGPILGEKVGWRRWAAVGVGFVGILIVLDPRASSFSLDSLLPFASALMFAIYLVATRHVSRDDLAEVSFFWTGISGAVVATLLGWPTLGPVAMPDLPWLILLCCTAALAHYLLIRCYEIAEASSLQPFAYTQLLWITLLGVLVFGETLAPNVILGGLIVVAASLFTWWRERQRA